MAWRRGTSRGYRRGMEVFEDVWFARLRSEVYGSYLHADEDGRSVYHGSLPRGGSPTWSVDAMPAASSFCAATRVSWLSRRSVAVDDFVGNEDTFRSEVVRVPPSEGQDRPELPIATQSGFLVTACFPSLLREIQFVGEDDLDNIGEGQVSTTVENRGRSVQLLREKIAKLVGYDDFTMCVRAGRHGQMGNAPLCSSTCLAARRPCTSSSSGDQHRSG